MSVLTSNQLFVERRKDNRRRDADRCANLEIDLYHRKRRISKDRRAQARSQIEDISAFYQAQAQKLETTVQ